MSAQRLLQQQASIYCFNQPSYCRHITCISALRQQNLKASDFVANQRFGSRKQGLGICKVAAEADVQQQEIALEEQDLEILDSEVEEESDDVFQEEEDTDPEPLVQPSPRLDVQQTLQRSFYLVNITQHTEEQAAIRVRPALAGEGRYFVRVPEGSLAEEATRQIEEAEDPEQADKEEGAEVAPQQQGAESSEGRADAAEAEDASLEVEPILARGEDEDIVMAILENAVAYPEGCPFLTLQQGETRIFASEVLLSALEACGVDNARIEIEGNGEVPLYDGSATGFVHLIKEAGLRVAPGMDGSQSAPKKQLAPRKVITVRDGDAFISLLPSTGMCISCGIDHTAEARVIGKQWVSWSPLDEEELHYRWEIAPSRAYFTSPQERLDILSQGYFKACYEPLTVVADGDEWARVEDLRFLDEPVRRRLLEFLGSMSLLSEGGRGGIPYGHVISFQAGWELQLRFLRAVKKVCGEAVVEY